MLDLSYYKQTSREIGILPFYWRIVVKPHVRQAQLIFSLMVVGALLEMVTVGLVVPLLDAIMGSERAADSWVILWVQGALRWWGLSPDNNLIIVFMLTLAVLLFLVKSGFSVLYGSLTAITAHRLRRETRSALLDGVLYARYEELSRRGRGATLQDITAPAGAVHSTIIQLGMLVSGILNSVMLLVLMFYLSWWSTLLIGLVVILGFQMMRKIMDLRARKCGQAIYELQVEQSRLHVDAVDGIKVVKGYRLEDQMSHKHRTLLNAEIRPVFQLALFQHVPPFLNEAAAGVIVLGLGVITFLWPNIGMSFSTLVAFLIAIRRVSPAIASVNGTLVDLNKSRRGVEVIEEILHLMPREEFGQKTVSNVEEIRFDGLSFRYLTRPDHWALEEVDFTMRRGMVTAVVGPTGAGKSTLANLLIGLYRPSSGKILINETDLSELSLQAWRGKVGYVSQDTFLFSATLRENIAVWDPEVRQEDVEWATRVAQLHDFVASLPDGYDTVVGDRGLRLSGGQCQRVAIARAILRRPEVLIFDEATSALDNLTEKAVYEAISLLHAGSTVLVIAHRLSSVREADQIVVLQAGRVVEVGTHNSLMQERGVYSRLYEMDVLETTRPHKLASKATS